MNRISIYYFLLVVICLIIFTIPGSVNASFIDYIQNTGEIQEKNVKPAEPNVKPEPGNEPTKEEYYENEKKETIEHIGKISGNIYEDLYLFDEDIGTYTKNNILNEKEKGTLNSENVKLVAKKVEDEKYEEIIKINSDGSYSFSPNEYGHYYFRMYYGKIDDENIYNNSDSVKNILKYNGQDYVCSKAGEDKCIDLSYKHEIISNGKGCIQVYLAIDCSNSMVETANSYEKSNLELSINAAKKLISELLESNQNNIYIGLVAFGEYPYKIQGLTKSKEKLDIQLNNLLDQAKNWNKYDGCTDIYSAIHAIRCDDVKRKDGEKTIEGDNNFFINSSKDDSNRYVFILSDGMPLAAGNDLKIYKEDVTNGELENKINQISEKTKKELNLLIEDGINGTVLITKTGDDEVDNSVKSMINDDMLKNLKRYAANPEVAPTIISETVKENIISQVKESTSNEKVYIESGIENQERRQEIDKIYKETEYNLSETMIYDILEKYNPLNLEDIEKAKKISQLWSFADTGIYEIYDYGSSWIEDGGYAKNSDGTEYHIIRNHVANKEVDNQDIVLSSKDNFMVDVELKVTGIRLSLANGQTIINNISENDKFLDSDLRIGEIRQVDNVKNVMCYYLDTQLMQNAKIDIEYTAIVKNKSAIPCKKLEIVLYTPEDFFIEDTANLLSIPNKTNSDIGWDVKLTNQLIDDDKILEKKGNCCATLIFDDSKTDVIRNGIIKSNGERYAKIVVSKKLSPTSNEDFYVADAEVISYTNESGRRMQQKVENTNVKSFKTIDLVSVFAGNHAESDYVKSQEVILIPPTGLKKLNNIELLSVILGILSVIGCCIIIKTNKK